MEGEFSYMLVDTIYVGHEHVDLQNVYYEERMFDPNSVKNTTPLMKM